MGIKQQLHDDIDTLLKWSEEVQMLFNFEKCVQTWYGNTWVK